LEVAALLHGVGKIGIPDAILRKPGPLNSSEYNLMSRHLEMTAHVLSSCCADESVIDIVRNAGHWYHSRRQPEESQGDNLPLGARMLAIVNAYDSMTSSHYFRKAMAREQASAELFAFAGTQFDPNLIREFHEFGLADQPFNHPEVARTWLKSLQDQPENKSWAWRCMESPPAADSNESFYEGYLESTLDAVIFIDSNLNIVKWNDGAERLTGIIEESVLDRRWLPSLVSLRDSSGNLLSDEDCPVLAVLQNADSTLLRMELSTRAGSRRSVNVHIFPILSNASVVSGAAVEIRDVSDEETLERRYMRLQKRITLDPLTQAANRAEFDRSLAVMVDEHSLANTPFSLVICDIDHFKSVNDLFGHQAGDEAIKTFTTVLKGSARQEDLVARYGGEEFAVLCPNCDNEAATVRAERWRSAICETDIEPLKGRRITASFGVTELQPGDTAETILRRADRALLKAKQTGRNRVVQLGVGEGEQQDSLQRPKRFWQFWIPWHSNHFESVSECEMSCAVPLGIVIEKLKGFVADREAEVLNIERNEARLEVLGSPCRCQKCAKRGKKPVRFIMDLTFLPHTRLTHGGSNDQHLEASTTDVIVRITPEDIDKKKQKIILHQAALLIRSLRSYLAVVVPEE